MAAHTRALEVRAPIEGVHGIAFRRTDGEDLMPARCGRPAQVDEDLLPSAQAARQHDQTAVLAPRVSVFASIVMDGQYASS